MDSYIKLTKEQIDEMMNKAVQIGAQEAIRMYEKKLKSEYREKSDRRLRNTKLLLRNFHMLKEHAESSVFGKSQMVDSASDILSSMMNIYDDDVVIDSIKRSATRTAIIVAHVETMLGLYEAYCEKESSQSLERRRYEVMYDKYIADPAMTVKEIADKQQMSKENVYADLRIAIEHLTALLFGVDGLKAH